MQEKFCLPCDLRRNEDNMAAKIANIFDFLRGLFCGILIGLTERPTNPRSAINDFLQKR